MGELVIQGAVTMQELIASSLAQTDALTKLLVEKGIITKDEFMVKLSDERAVYREMLKKMTLILSCLRLGKFILGTNCVPLLTCVPHTY